MYLYLYFLAWCDALYVFSLSQKVNDRFIKKSSILEVLGLLFLMQLKVRGSKRNPLNTVCSFYSRVRLVFNTCAKTSPPLSHTHTHTQSLFK